MQIKFLWTEGEAPRQVLKQIYQIYPRGSLESLNLVCLGANVAGMISAYRLLVAVERQPVVMDRPPVAAEPPLAATILIGNR
jgi:hypothetical protein